MNSSVSNRSLKTYIIYLASECRSKSSFESTSYRLNNLENIKAPTVVLQRTDDPIVPVEAAQEIAAKIPGAELIIVPGVGHNIPSQLTQTFADAITKGAQRAISLMAP
jgi:pimeloyl-ACP methyl ester carboxylesterase